LKKYAYFRYQIYSHALKRSGLDGFVTRDFYTRLKTRLALVPPKPKLLDSATSILRCLAVWGTKSMSQPSEGFSRLSVGGAIWLWMASTEKIASTAPAAPSRW